jgi:hypothetical protein
MHLRDGGGFRNQNGIVSCFPKFIFTYDLANPKFLDGEVYRLGLESAGFLLLSEINQA